MFFQGSRLSTISTVSALILAFQAASHQAAAQDIRFNGLWTGCSVQNHFGPWLWTLNLANLANPQHRRFENLDYPASDIRLQMVNLVGYRHGDHWTWTAGFHYQRNYPFDNRYSNEFRPFEQLEYRHRIRSLSVNHMLRLNQRFIQLRNEDRYSLNHSLQYRTTVSWPLHKATGQRIWSLDAFSEEYFGLAGPLVYDRLCEFWFSVAVACQWKSTNKISLGLGHEYLIRNSALDKRIIWYPALNYTGQIRWR